MTSAYGQDRNDGGKTGGSPQGQFFACIQSTLRNKVRRRGLMILDPEEQVHQPPHTQPCPGSVERREWRGGKGHGVHMGTY
jgi:hypothetical protein